MPGSNYVKIACDSFQKPKLAQFHIQSEESKTSKLSLFFPILQSFGKWHLNTIELTSCVVHVFCGFMTVSKDSKKFKSPLKTPWRHILLLNWSYAFDRFPSMFWLCFRCINFHYANFKFFFDARNNSKP